MSKLQILPSPNGAMSKTNLMKFNLRILCSGFVLSLKSLELVLFIVGFKKRAVFMSDSPEVLVSYERS